MVLAASRLTIAEDTELDLMQAGFDCAHRTELLHRHACLRCGEFGEQLDRSGVPCVASATVDCDVFRCFCSGDRLE